MIKASVLLLTLVLLGTLGACSGDGLRFESLKSFYSEYRETSPKIVVVADNDSPLPDGIDQQYWRQALGSINYSEQVVVFVFHGWQPVSSNKVFEVASVQESDDTILVTARVLIWKANSVISEILSPAEVIRVEKTSMHSFGHLTFKLLDTRGEERATTTAFISEP